MPREASILDRTRRYLGSLGPSHFLKTSGDGEPDLVGCVSGRSVVCETKQPGEKPRPAQYLRLRQWAAAGAWSLWTDGETFYHVDAAGTETPVGLFPRKVAK